MSDTVTKGERLILQALERMGHVLISQATVQLCLAGQDAKSAANAINVMRNHVRFINDLVEASFEK